MGVMLRDPLERAKQLAPRASKAQIRYLIGLLDDCGFNTIRQRNAWLSSITHRDILFTDELDVAECSTAIDLLLLKKCGLSQSSPTDELDD